MKRILAILSAAAMALSVTACGKNAESSSQHETEIASDDEFKLDIPPFDSRAGINMTAEPMPDLGDIPSDWHEITNGKLTFMVPADVKMSEGGSSIKSAKSADKAINIMFFNGNDWTVQSDYADVLDSEAASDAEGEYDELGYPKTGDLTDEKTEKYMAAMGYEYDGSQLSRYKALLSMTSADRTEDNAEAFDYLATLKASMFGMVYPKVRYLESDGIPVYFETYAGLTYDPAEADEDAEYKSLWVSAFAEPDLEYTAMIRANSQEEALMIASTVGIK